MTITQRFQARFEQYAVYWGTPSNDGRGKFTFGVNEEVQVKWHDFIGNFAKDSASRVRISKNGEEYRPSSVIYSTVAPTGGWDLNGYLYLGRLADLPASPSPYSTQNAFEIKEIKKAKEWLTDGFLYIIYL